MTASHSSINPNSAKRILLDQNRNCSSNLCDENIKYSYVDRQEHWLWSLNKLEPNWWKVEEI